MVDSPFAVLSPELLRDAMTAADAVEFAACLIRARRTTLPRRLVEPGPDAAQLRSLFEAAAAAPDHDQILPWRFVVVAASARERLGEAFARALSDRDPSASEDDLDSARKKALRAPLLMLLTVETAPHLGDVPEGERFLSAGCAVQNLMLQAEAMGFGTSLTSGQSLNSEPVRELFGLLETEIAVCFVNVGTPVLLRPFNPRPRPEFFVRHLS